MKGENEGEGSGRILWWRDSIAVEDEKKALRVCHRDTPANLAVCSLVQGHQEKLDDES